MTFGNGTETNKMLPCKTQIRQATASPRTLLPQVVDFAGSR